MYTLHRCAAIPSSLDSCRRIPRRDYGLCAKRLVERCIKQYFLERFVRRSAAPLARLNAGAIYDPSKIAIIPIAFCHPGKAASDDRSPRPEYAPRWHGKLNSHLPDIGLTLLIGQYAQAYYVGRCRKATLRDTVLAWKEYLPAGYLPLAHPSPRNQPSLVKNR